MSYNIRVSHKFLSFLLKRNEYIIFFQKASLFPFSKIIEVYLQNIPRGAFLLRFGIGENFLITNNSRQESPIFLLASFNLS